jgi:hypothetical protein
MIVNNGRKVRVLGVIFNSIEFLRGFLRLASISCGSKLTGMGYDSCQASVNNIPSSLQNQGW